jgi:hypothetical protein
MFFKKKKSLEKYIAELEKRLEKVEDKLSDFDIVQVKQKNDDQITPAQILNEWLNGAKEG